MVMNVHKSLIGYLCTVQTDRSRCVWGWKTGMDIAWVDNDGVD